MESKIAMAIQMKYSPVAVVFTNEKPDSALQFKEGKWGCVIAMLNAAVKGKTAVFDRKTFGCLGGGTGLGFGSRCGKSQGYNRVGRYFCQKTGREGYPVIYSTL